MRGWSKDAGGEGAPGGNKTWGKESFQKRAMDSSIMPRRGGRSKDRKPLDQEALCAQRASSVQWADRARFLHGRGDRLRKGK